MNQSLMSEISDRENRINDAVEFFGWPRDLIELMFKHSKAYFENVWQRFYPDYVREYYASGFYTIRQLSYSEGEIFTEDVSKILDQVDGSCFDFACGVGDYIIYLARSGCKVFACEHPGIPMQFLQFRLKKYGIDVGLYLNDGPYRSYPVVDYTLLISAIDHIDDPIRFVKTVCSCTRKKIFATPCIDETYDRPTHIKSILKDVPKAFEVIREHNATKS